MKTLYTLMYLANKIGLNKKKHSTVKTVKCFLLLIKQSFKQTSNSLYLFPYKLLLLIVSSAKKLLML